MQLLNALIERIASVVMIYEGEIIEVDGYKIFIKFPSGDAKHNCRSHIQKTEKKRYGIRKSGHDGYGHGLVMCVEIFA